MGHFGPTYLPMSDVLYTMPITLVRFLLRYLPTPKLDVLYEHSQSMYLITPPQMRSRILLKIVRKFRAYKVQKVQACKNIYVLSEC